MEIIGSLEDRQWNKIFVPSMTVSKKSITKFGLLHYTIWQWQSFISRAIVPFKINNNYNYNICKKLETSFAFFLYFNHNILCVFLNNKWSIVFYNIGIWLQVGGTKVDIINDITVHKSSLKACFHDLWFLNI